MKKVKNVLSVKENCENQLSIVFEDFGSDILIDKEVFEKVFNSDVSLVVEELNNVWRKNESYKEVCKNIGIHSFIVEKDAYKTYKVFYESVSYREVIKVELEFDY